MSDLPPVGEVVIQGHSLICPICKNNQFWSRRVEVELKDASTEVLTQFPTKSEINLVCTKCGYIFWFRHPLKFD